MGQTGTAIVPSRIAETPRGNASDTPSSFDDYRSRLPTGEPIYSLDHAYDLAAKLWQTSPGQSKGETISHVAKELILHLSALTRRVEALEKLVELLVDEQSTKTDISVAD